MKLTWEERGKTLANSVKLGKVSPISTLLNLVTVVLLFSFRFIAE